MSEWKNYTQSYIYNLGIFVHKTEKEKSVVKFGWDDNKFHPFCNCNKTINIRKWNEKSFAPVKQRYYLNTTRREMTSVFVYGEVGYTLKLHPNKSRHCCKPGECRSWTGSERKLLLVNVGNRVYRELRHLNFFSFPLRKYFTRIS